MLQSTHHLISKIRMAFYTPSEIESITNDVLTKYKGLCSSEIHSGAFDFEITLDGSPLEKIAHHLRAPNETGKSVWGCKQREYPAASNQSDQKEVERTLSMESIRSSFIPCAASQTLHKAAEKCTSDFLQFAKSKAAITSIGKLGNCIALIKPSLIKSKAAATKKSKRVLFMLHNQRADALEEVAQSTHPGRNVLMLEIKDGLLGIKTKSLESLVGFIEQNLESIEAKVNNEKIAIDLEKNLFLNAIIGTTKASSLGQINPNSLKRIYSEFSSTKTPSDVRCQLYTQSAGSYVNNKECLGSVISEEFFNYFEKIFGGTQTQICVEIHDTDSLSTACSLSKVCDAPLQITFFTHQRTVYESMAGALSSLHASIGHEARASHILAYEIGPTQIEQVKINALYDAWLLKMLKSDATDHEICRVMEEKVLCLDINHHLGSGHGVGTLEHNYLNIIEYASQIPSVADGYKLTFGADSKIKPIRITKNTSNNEQLEFINATSFIGSNHSLEANGLDANSYVPGQSMGDDVGSNIFCPYSFADEFLNSQNADLSFTETRNHPGNYWSTLGIKNNSSYLVSNKNRRDKLPSLQETVQIAFDEVVERYDQLKFVQVLLSELTSIRKLNLVVTEIYRLKRLAEIERYVPSMLIGEQEAKVFLRNACLTLDLIDSNTAVSLDKQRKILKDADAHAHNHLALFLTPYADKKNMSEKLVSLLADILVEHKTFGDLGRETTTAIVLLAGSVCGVSIRKNQIVDHIESLFSETAYAIRKGGVKLDQAGLVNGTYDFKTRLSESDIAFFESTLKKYVAIQASTKEPVKRNFWLI